MRIDLNLHPYFTIRMLQKRIDDLEEENVDLFRENRDYKNNLGKEKEVALAADRAKYWYDRWLTLYRLLSESQKTQEKQTHGTETF